MDYYLNLVLTWLRTLNIAPDLDKLKRQLSIIDNWFKANGKGILEAVTGFGKTMVAIIIIYRLTRKNFLAETIVVVPNLNLQTSWRKLIGVFGLQNVNVYVVNSYVKAYLTHNRKWKCDLLVADEVHNYASENAEIFSQVIGATEYTYVIALTATLEEQEREFLLRVGIPVIDTVTLSEAKRQKYISNYRVYNLGISLNTEEREKYNKLNDIHNNNFGKFRYFAESNSNWELARACGAGNNVRVKVGDEWKTGQEWRNWYADIMEWDNTKDHVWSPTNINKYAQQWAWAMRERKNFLHKHNSKINTAVEVINHLNKKTITFSESTEFADELSSVLGAKAKAYHSNLNTAFRYEEKSEIRKQAAAAKNFKKKVGGNISVNPEGGWKITYTKEVKISKKELKANTLEEFKEGKISVLATAKALDEGTDIPDIEVAIICSASSKKRQNVQRMGRSIRFVEDKIATIVNLYIKETQDESWLKRRQQGDPGVIWIDNVNDIIL